MTLNNALLKEALKEYKNNLNTGWWEDEKYKLEAIKCFQDNWDIDADDFPSMLKKSLEKTDNLLGYGRAFRPRKAIIDLAQYSSEEVRKMFINLYDETKDIYERIEAFKNASSTLHKEYDPTKHDFQTENPISVYLWLRFPDKYFIYKFQEINNVSKKLDSKLNFKSGGYKNNISNWLKLYNEINNEIKKDKDLIDLYKTNIDNDSNLYADPNLITLTNDVCFFISRRYLENDKQLENNEGWLPKNYDPGIDENTWISLLKDKTLFDENSLEVMKCLKDNGGQGSCFELAKKYGKTLGFYNAVSSKLGQRVFEKTHCNVLPNGENKNAKRWPILYLYRKTKIDGTKVIEYKLRDELKSALDKIDLNKDDSSTKQEIIYSSYSKQDFLNEVFMDEKMYDDLVELLTNKKNVILQGAPGVGKTFTAKRLAASLLKEKNDNYIEFVQFHQNYSYEDFVMGYKPIENGFELKYGIFYQFCKKAIKEPNKNFYFIIDEINRGNISKIFGELLMLIENSYRDKPISLSYNGESFYVPNNLYIIGLMNTADRSLAMIDYALRRRFSFFEMNPAFDSEGFSKYQKNIDNKKFDELILLVKKLNEEILNDKTLGKGFCIGHSYFCDLKDYSDSSLSLIVRYDILPTLNEYWFDDIDKLMKWQNKFHGIFE